VFEENTNALNPGFTNAMEKSKLGEAGFLSMIFLVP
jgi:hypothetical protein